MSRVFVCPDAELAVGVGQYAVGTTPDADTHIRQRSVGRRVQYDTSDRSGLPKTGFG
jgi:hypothetical protein